MQPEQHQCPSHGMFEQLMQQSINNLAEKIEKGIDTFSKQSANNGQMLQRVLDNQAERKELCGKQSARIDNHDDQLAGLWEQCNSTKKMVWVGLGIGVTVQIIAVPIFIWLITKGGSL